MVYIIAGIFVALCIVVIIFGFRILKDTRKLHHKKDDKEIRFRP